MPPEWSSAQFNRVVDQFKTDCPKEAWDDLLLRYSVLRARGPLCGPAVAKKLRAGDGIWELVGHADNCQPRLLFYFSGASIVFVHAFIKKGKSDYRQAIALAQARRRLIERKERIAYAIESLKSSIH